MADFRKRKDSILSKKDVSEEEDLKDLKTQLKNEIKVQKQIQKIEMKKEHMSAGK